MFKVTRSQTEIVVLGPESFEKRIDPTSIGVAMRTEVSWPYEDVQPYAIRCRHMTDEELVAVALGIESYPT